MKKKVAFIVLTLLLSLVLFTGCDKKDEDPKQSEVVEDTTKDEEKSEDKEEKTEESDKAEDQADATTTIGDKYDRSNMGPEEDQYLNVNLGTEPTSFDASLATDSYAFTVLNNTMEALTRFEENEEGIGEIMPAGAESWDISEDGLVYTFALRDNKWSDGEPVTASDYEYGIKRTINAETGSASAYNLLMIKNAEAVNSGDMDVDELGVKALDDKTLEITLDSPTPYFLSLTYQANTTPQRQDIVEQFGDTYGAEAGNAVYSGPFMVKEWVHNSQVVLEKNPNYWDAENVSLHTITLKIIQEETAAYNAFESREIDLVGSSKREWIDKFSAMEDVNYVSYVNTQTFYMFFNHEDSLFQNTNMRKAFVTAVDRDELSNTIWAGTYEPAYGWVPRGLYAGDINYRDAVEEPNLRLMKETEDPKDWLLKGMEELNLGDDPSSLKIRLDLAGTSQWFKTYGEYLQQRLKTVLGVEIELGFQDWPVFSSKTETGDYQLAYAAWGAEYNDPGAMLNLLQSGSTAIQTNWSNEKYDALLEEASTELDQEKRVELFKEAEEILLYEDAAINPMVYPRAHSFRRDFIYNMTEIPLVTQGYKYTYIGER